MVDLTEWAKREATVPFPTLPQAQTGAEWGILHLAEALQREDVIEAAGLAKLIADELSDWDWQNERDRRILRGLADRIGPKFVAAMLAKIAEGGAS